MLPRILTQEIFNYGKKTYTQKISAGGGPLVRGLARYALKLIKRIPKEVSDKDIKVLKSSTKVAEPEVEILGWETPFRNEKGNIIGYIQHENPKFSKKTNVPKEVNEPNSYMDEYTQSFEDLDNAEYDFWTSPEVQGAGIGLSLGGLGTGVSALYNEYKKNKEKNKEKKK